MPGNKGWTLVGAGTLVLGLWVWSAQAQSPQMPPTPVRGNPELIAFTSPAGEGVQLLLVVDPKQRAVTSYHVDLQSGKIALKSARNIQGDLSMLEFNGASPLPHEIRSMLDRGRRPAASERGMPESPPRE